jgi:hypothetical protein
MKKFSFRVNAALGTLLVCFLSGCATPMKQKSYSDYCKLSSAELESFTAAARRGDGSACYKLYFHYSAGHNKVAEGMYWLRKGAALGDADSLEALKILERE